MNKNVALLGAAIGVMCASSASALDLPSIDKKPLKLDVTEASILVQRFDPRTTQGESPGDGGFGYWVNRINAALSWQHFTLGVRLDSSLWWRQPHDAYGDNAAQSQTLADSQRFPQTLYPAKVFLTYNAAGIEATVGDAYVQFARGLLISMRKMDDLGIDNTVRGAKLAVSRGPFTVTAVGGFMNPSRVDEASGQMLFLQRTPQLSQLNSDPSIPNPVFGSDRVIGAELQAGRGSPIVLSTSAVRFTRCAPYAYDAASGRFNTGDASLGETAFGTCDDASTKQWLSTLNDGAPTRRANTVDMVAQSVEIPRLGKFGNLYAVGAIQRRTFDFEPERNGAEAQGSAIYGSYSGSYGPVTNTFEFKGYRNFRPVVASVAAGKAPAFSFVSYSAPPTTEVLTQDNLGTNDFNACATGGRLRTDVRMNKHLLTYVQGIYEVSQSEQSGASCDKHGDVVGAYAKTPDRATNYVWDGTAGIQLDWDQSRSYVYALVNARNDMRGDGTPYLRQEDFEYTVSAYLGKAVSKALRGPASLELVGRNRMRYQADENYAETANGKAVATRWFEGENYVALKLAPKWIFTTGFEYTSKVALPTWYPNASVVYKFKSDSNIKLFVGEQRGGLKCVSGVCRIFPAFEGARLELTMRF